MKNHHPFISPFEEKVMLLVKDGLSNDSIANVLEKSPDTIKYHLKNIYRKLNAKNRIDAMNKFNKILNI